MRELMLLTGTPISRPGDSFAYIKLRSPEIYRNLTHFERLHVGERDFWDNVVRWENLDFLHENLMLNSVRLLKREELGGEDPLYDPIEYELDDEHYRLYKKLASEQLLLTEDGGKIDATVAARLYNMLQQIVCNPAHFSGNPKMRPAAFDLLDELIDELLINDRDDSLAKKLIVSANYVMTNRSLLQYLKPYGAVAFYGEISEKEKDYAKDRFIDDPTCKIAIVQPTSAGYGIDGWQSVCSDLLFLEAPIIPSHFHQVVGRLDRPGQKVRPHVRVATAAGTIQNRLFNSLLVKDQLVNQVQGGWQDLREAIYGKA
jgi:hypothetical protein